MNRITKMWIKARIQRIVKIILEHGVILYIVANGLIILSLVYWIATVEARMGELSKEHIDFRDIKEVKRTLQTIQEEKNPLMKLPETLSPEQVYK